MQKQPWPQALYSDSVVYIFRISQQCEHVLCNVNKILEADSGPVVIDVCVWGKMKPVKQEGERREGREEQTCIIVAVEKNHLSGNFTMKMGCLTAGFTCSGQLGSA